MGTMVSPCCSPGDGKLVPHGGMACWYAAAEMVSKYLRPGPRLGLPDVWKRDNGLSPTVIDALAKAEGLRVVSRPDGGLTATILIELLRTYGPLWSAVNWEGSGHVIVLTGVKGDNVYFNDPWEPSKKVRPVSWFVSSLLPFPNALLAKDPVRS
jgi:Papain-like cysteine protease AvrRpt2